MLGEKGMARGQFLLSRGIRAGTRHIHVALLVVLATRSATVGEMPQGRRASFDAQPKASVAVATLRPGPPFSFLRTGQNPYKSIDGDTCVAPRHHRSRGAATWPGAVVSVHAAALRLRGGFQTGMAIAAQEEEESVGYTGAPDDDDGNVGDNGGAGAFDVADDEADFHDHQPGESSAASATASDDAAEQQSSESLGAAQDAGARKPSSTMRNAEAMRESKIENFDPSSDEEGREAKWLEVVDELVEKDDAQVFQSVVAKWRAEFEAAERV